MFDSYQQAALANAPFVRYRRSQRARYLRISIHPDGNVVVTVPRLCRMEQARQFLVSKTTWVQQKLSEIRNRQRSLLPSIPDSVDLEEAQQDLFNRLEAFSQHHNLPYNRAVFRCQKTKWGSCSGQNNINLNINIAFLPRHLQDYVLLHELAHIRIKNHSKSYWVLLDRLCGKRAKDLAKELRSYTMKIKK